MKRHSWPGNVRELEHAVEHASVLCKSDIIAVRDLPQGLIDFTPERSSADLEDAQSPSSSKKSLTVEEALKMCGGNKTRAANLMGVNRTTVYRHLEKS